MNKITNTTIKYIEEYLQIVKEPIQESSFNQHSLYIDFLPQFIKDFYNGSNLTVESIFMIFEILSVEPTRSYQNIKDNLRFIDNQEEEISLKSKELVNKQSLFHILNLINISIYLLKQKNENEDFKTLLMTMAINIYENLYSSRGKMKFAYYFRKLLDHHEKPYTLITAYKSSSWRGEYGNYTKVVKEYIDELPLSSHNDRIHDYTIKNIIILRGQMKDTKLAEKEMQYFIQMGTFDIVTQDFQPLFSTNFK
jgi:hypothetical protein